MLRTCAVIVLTAAAAAAAPLPAAAQHTIGIKAGPGIADFTGSTLERSDWSRGFTGGAFATYALVDELSFQLEAMYVRKGARLTFARQQLTRSGTVRLDYVEVPALLRIDLRPHRGPGLHLIGGPAAAILLRCTFDEDEVDSVGCSDGGLPLGVHRLDAGMLAAAGLDVTFGRAALILELRYGFGLVNVDADENFRRANEALSIVAGVSIRRAPRAPLTAHR